MVKRNGHFTAKRNTNYNAFKELNKTNFIIFKIKDNNMCTMIQISYIGTKQFSHTIIIVHIQDSNIHVYSSFFYLL